MRLFRKVPVYRIKSAFKPESTHLQDQDVKNVASGTQLQDKGSHEDLTTGAFGSERHIKYLEHKGFGVPLEIGVMSDPKASQIAQTVGKPSKKRRRKKSTPSIRVVTPAQSLSNRSLKKHAAAIHTEGNLSLLQRKLSNVLLLNAYDALLTQTEHVIDEKNLCMMLGYDSNDRKPLKESLKALASVQAEWNILGSNQEEVEWGVSSLLSHAVLSRGKCRYGYSSALAEKLYNPEIYASINMRIQRKFRSKHALTLYENCQRFRKVRSTGWWTLETFRKLMGVEDSDYYHQFKHLNAKVIKPTVKEINAVSDIEITPEFKRCGRSISEIRFLIGVNAQRPLLDIDDDGALKGTTVYQRLVATGISHKLAENWITEHGEAYCAAKLDILETQKASGTKIMSMSGFLAAAIKDDYKDASAGPTAEEREKTQIREAARERQAEADRRKALSDIEAREAEKRAMLTRVAAVRAWFNAKPSDEQARLLEKFEPTLDKSFLLDDFKRGKLDKVAVASRFADFIDPTLYM